MTPPVKPRTAVGRRTVMIFLWLTAMAASLTAAPRGQQYVLSKSNSLPSGTVLREIREIRAENGKRTITGPNGSVNSMRYVHRANLVRRIGGIDREQVSVRESVRGCTFYLGRPPPPNEMPSPLQPLDLRLRRVSGRWLYELDKGTPTQDQVFSLAELGQLADMISVVNLCGSAQPRSTGDTWKVEAPRVPGKGYGYVAAEGIECRLEDVTEVEGAPHARMAVSGKFKIERPLNLNGTVNVTFAGTVTRRLTDMLDVDTTLSGTFTYAGPVLAKDQPANATIEVPWTMTRTQKLEPK